MINKRRHYNKHLNKLLIKRIYVSMIFLYILTFHRKQRSIHTSDAYVYIRAYIFRFPSLKKQIQTRI